MSKVENIKVAVRLRPFKRIFEALGVGLLDNAWLGYNCTIFAYGQTGSGKSYSMMGYEPNRGIVPLLGEKLFQGITEKKNPDVIYKVSVSMLEIYNEKVQDLLIGTPQQPQRGLATRMSPKHGFYVEGLSQFAVSTCTDITHHIENGNTNRTVAATKMNETSSRAHTIVIISFTQNFIKENKSKQSQIYMVDLAGSERAAQTGATGARFNESKSINKSLMTLGTVIKNLCAIACGRTDQGPTPYRDSKLTMLLKDAIGGNCKTIMVATISPSEDDYEQTLSTLRYADRVKSIKNVVIKNIEATDKLIMDLLAEKQALLSKLTTLPRSKTGYTDEDLKKLKDEQANEIEQLKNEMHNVEVAWQKRLQDARKQMEKQIEAEQKVEKDRKRIPHLWNLNEDPSLSRKIFHFIREGETINVGNRRSPTPAQIELHGPSIAKHHAVIHNRHGDISIKPVQGSVKVNGKPIKQQTTVKHQDRIFFGASNLFVLQLPSRQEDSRDKLLKAVTYEMAQGEIARYLQDVQTDGVDWLKEEIAEMLLLTQESNAMAREMEKDVMFEPLVLAKHYSQDVKRTKVYILVRTGNGGEFLWGRNHFLDRYDLMTDMYQKYVEGNVSWQPKSPTQDPFWEPLETPTLIGLAYVPLESIAYMLDIEEQKIGIYDYQAGHAGYINVELVPCTNSGDECSEEQAVEEPTELVGHNITFKVKIKGATGIPKRFKTSWCHYTFHTEERRYYTDEKMGVCPKYNYEHMHVMSKVTHVDIEYLEDRAIVIEVYGRQGSSYDQRRGSLFKEYTMADNRRMSHLLPTASTSMSTMTYHSSDGSLASPSRVEFDAMVEANRDTLSTDFNVTPTKGQEDLGDMIDEIVNNMSETNTDTLDTTDDHTVMRERTVFSDTASTDLESLYKDVNGTDLMDDNTSKFTAIQKGISDMVDDIVRREEEKEQHVNGIDPGNGLDVDPDGIEQMLNLSSNTTLHILREVLQSTTRDLKESEKALATANNKIGKIDNVIKNKKDKLATEIKTILKD